MTARVAQLAQLPADSHVHSRWSWDAPHSSMQWACRYAVELDLPSIVFTDFPVVYQPTSDDGWQTTTLHVRRYHHD